MGTWSVTYNARGIYGYNGRRIDDERLSRAESEGYTSIVSYVGRGICFGGASCAERENCYGGANSVWRTSGCCDESCAGSAICLGEAICDGRATCYGIGVSGVRGT